MKVELLAPAGSMESLKAAAGAGADAVYVGGSAFGARAYAKNFTEEELLYAIDYMHLLDKKLYLTVNTLLKNKELEEELYQYLEPLYRQGLDAVLVQDMGALSFIRENFPGLTLHASTQMTITGVDGAKFVERQGVARVVPARELSLDEIAQIRRETNLEIETFIHGALCYSYSGQCLFSSILGGRSGNRGRCAQPCRLPYKTSGSKNPNQCPLSMKDINTLDILPDIIEVGVCSLKIEGRMKQPEYAAGVVGIYRKYLDLYEESPDFYKVQKADREFLRKIFHRGGSCTGYYQQKNGPDMISFTNDKKTESVNVNLKQEQKEITGYLSLKVEEPSCFTLIYKDTAVTVHGECAQKAQKQPLTKERIEAQMHKNSSSVFELHQLEIDMDEDVFIQMGALNHLRRDAYEALEEELLSGYRRAAVEKKSVPLTANNRDDSSEPDYYASFETMEQMKVLLQEPNIRGFFCPIHLMDELLRRNTDNREIFLALPHVVRGNELKKYKKNIQNWICQGVSGILVRNLESVGFLKENGWMSLAVLDHFLYAFNDRSVDFWKTQSVQGNTIPLELNAKEIGHRNNQDSYQVVYGYMPLMVSAQCVQKNTDTCRRNHGSQTIVDRYEKSFLSKCYCDTCYNVIYNCVPMQLSEEMKRLQQMGIHRLRLDFTLEDQTETKKIADAFLYHNYEFPRNSYTKGHFKRGVE